MRLWLKISNLQVEEEPIISQRRREKCMNMKIKKGETSPKQHDQDQMHTWWFESNFILLQNQLNTTLTLKSWEI